MDQISTPTMIAEGVANNTAPQLIGTVPNGFNGEILFIAVKSNNFPMTVYIRKHGSGVDWITYDFLTKTTQITNVNYALASGDGIDVSVFPVGTSAYVTCSGRLTSVLSNTLQVVLPMFGGPQSVAWWQLWGTGPQEEDNWMSWRSSRSDGVSWGQIKADVVHGLVVSASAEHCGVTFGQTKDGSALVVTLLAGDSARETTYARSSEDVSTLLSDMQQPEFAAWAKDHQPV